jgi:hypothetical protein
LTARRARLIILTNRGNRGEGISLRGRVVLSICILAVVLAAALPSSALDGDYNCHDSQLIAHDPAVITAVASAGPSCGVVITCPINVNQCTVKAYAAAGGVGDPGVAVHLGLFGPSAVCAGLLLGCATQVVTAIIGPGDQITAEANWSGGPGSATALFAEVTLVASREDS